VATAPMYTHVVQDCNGGHGCDHARMSGDDFSRFFLGKRCIGSRLLTKTRSFLIKSQDSKNFS